MRTLALFLFGLATLASHAQSVNDKMRDALASQAELDTSYANPEESPLLPEDLAEFEGHDYFPIDTNWMITAKVILTPDSVPFEMATTTERRPVYRQFAWLEFEHKDTTLRLAVYQNLRLIEREEYKNYLFLPFGDATNGNASYGGGRYLDLRIPEGDSIYIDFNQCYNPYCAYNGRYSCPRIPLVNLLPITITAGVMAPKGHH